MKIWSMFAVVAAISLSACTVVPGSHQSVPFDVGADEMADAELDFVTITPSVIQSLRPSSRSAGQALSAPAQGNYQYRIGIGDILSISVWEQPGSLAAAEGSAGTEVYSDGTIYFPYVGSLPVVGKTTQEIRQDLEKKLSRVINKPRIDVKVADYRSQKVYVSGEVQSPGGVAIDGTPMTLLRAIQVAGGPSDNANLRELTVVRGGVKQVLNLDEILKNGDWRGNVLLSNNDSVHVARNDGQKVLVMGEVRRTTSIAIGRADVSLAEALVEAGGLNERAADARGIFVLRNIDSTESAGERVYSATVYRLDAGRATGFLLAESFMLEPRDVVYVTAAPVARWNRLISAILPSVGFSRAVDSL